jgi:hypothetical protein
MDQAVTAVLEDYDARTREEAMKLVEVGPTVRLAEAVRDAWGKTFGRRIGVSPFRAGP